MGKYEPLRTYLESRSAETVPMTFAEIEKVLGFKLPRSQAYAAWWSNNPTNNVMTNEWLAAGFKTEQVDLEGRKVVFRRTSTPKAKAKERTTPPDSAASKPSPRHPLFGWMKGTVTVAPGVDLTEPADPEWGVIAWGTPEGESRK
jgi:hypothetical protein